MTNHNRTTVVAEPGDRKVIFTRVFDAPRELVWRVATEPTLVPEWWGPKGYTTTVEEMDVRPEGTWRYVQHGPGGGEFAFHGVYRTVEPPERLTYTFEWEGMPGHVIRETATFEEQDGATKMTVTDEFETAGDRDEALLTGMEVGAIESGDRFAEVLKQLK
ncbi:MAG: SRPBCC family protein [Halobacteriota archaeon]